MSILTLTGACAALGVWFCFSQFRAGGAKCGASFNTVRLAATGARIAPCNCELDARVVGTRKVAEGGNRWSPGRDMSRPYTTTGSMQGKTRWFHHRLLKLAKYSDLGRRARHAVPLRSEHGSCHDNSRDSVSERCRSKCQVCCPETWSGESHNLRMLTAQARAGSNMAAPTANVAARAATPSAIALPQT